MPAQTASPTAWSPLVPGLVWLGAWVAARVLLEMTTLDPIVRTAIALAPVPPFVWFLVAFRRGIRDTDELEQRIQLEALAFAFPVCVVLLMTLGLLELAAPLDPDNWSYRHVWAFMPAIYIGGLVLARRRYA